MMRNYRLTERTRGVCQQIEKHLFQAVGMCRTGRQSLLEVEMNGDLPRSELPAQDLRYNLNEGIKIHLFAAHIRFATNFPHAVVDAGGHGLPARFHRP